MRCSCQVDLELDDDGGGFYTETYPVARKKHQCIECSGDIVPGKKYEKIRQLYDGHWSTYKTCYDCSSMRAAMFCSSWFFGNIWGSLKDEISGNRDSRDSRYNHNLKLPSSECMMAMTQRGRDMVCDLIEEIWAEKEESDED